MAPRPCIETGCNRLAHNGPRCPPCQSQTDRARNQRREGARTWGRRTHRQHLNHAGAGTCATCRATLTADRLEIDHIIPLADGGTDTIDNTQVLCVPCHRRKTADEHHRRTRTQPQG